MSMTESATDDLTRDCPRDAAPAKKKRGGGSSGEKLGAAPAGVWGLSLFGSS
ncbi:MAG: hypothetical protein IJY46_01495 [Lentisphaeria bacterium]|nr:hypothetical protein [Lentisphaeria bacterium]